MFKLVCGLCVFIIGVTAGRNENVTTIEDIISSTKQSARIVNGQEAKAGQFPWQVSVTFYTSKGPAYCGGSLIHEKWVLTAAHCAKGAKNFTLRFGGTTLNAVELGRVDVAATKHYVHPGYNENTLNNDLALIELDNPVESSNTISTIGLPKRGEKTRAAEQVEVSGWGKTSDDAGVSNKLKYVQLTTISNLECIRSYGMLIVRSSTLCCSAANVKSTCNGDSGGPLVKRDSSGVVQVGVVSFVHPSGCSSGKPSGYIRTESYLDWIYQITGVVGGKESVSSAILLVDKDKITNKKDKDKKMEQMEKMMKKMHSMHGDHGDDDDDDEDHSNH